MVIRPNMAACGRIAHELVWGTGQEGCYLCSQRSIHRKYSNESRNIHTVKHYMNTTKCEGVGYGRMTWETHEVERSECNNKLKGLRLASSGRVGKLIRVSDGPI